MLFFTTLGLTHVVVAALSAAADAAAPEPTFEANVPVRAITQGPKSHWFAYYDKLQFDPTNRYVLGMEVDFDNRTNTADDVIKLGYIDLEKGDAWTEFAQTTAWCWQQGCMLQWLPGSDTKVIYNVREDGQYKSVIQDVFSGEKRTLPKPVYAVSPTGRQAVGLNFARVGMTRPGYGYYGIPDPGADNLHPADDGLYVMDLDTGDSKLLFTLDQISQYELEPDPEAGKHWFNHLLFNTDGTRFIFLHRWHRTAESTKGWHTRMLTAAVDGSGLDIVADHDMVSHFIWKNPKQILAWSREPEEGDRFHLYTDQSDEVEVIGDGVLKQDGHCTYSPDREWVLTDTYPSKERMQGLMLYRPSDGRLEMLGKFYLPKEQSGEIRCDLHARWSRDGRCACIDSMHMGGQRQLYLIDLSSIVKPQ
ncbi:MAG TPA: hypothetical protein PLO37_24955 [Candidatus Hydrogenedentes bacterium]|mgnify:CR=1 FL=1|nr:hypothetical protein [Candidatus Hydrogenedentota bacterium]HPG70110.1 hypothetical protein [Candidatus Hydrogenedentota bacterium]